MHGPDTFIGRIEHDALMGVAGVAVVGAAVFAAHEITGWDPFGNVNVKIEDPIHRQPPEVTAGVVQSTVDTEQEAFICPLDLSAGVYVHANQGIYIVDSSDESKVWFGRAQVCGDGNRLIASAQVYRTGKTVTKVVATLPPIVPYGAGIDLLDVRNDINISPKDDKEKDHQKVVKYLAAKAAGHQPGPSFGYNNTGAVIMDRDSDLIPDSMQAAQVALQLSALPQEAIDQDMPTIINDFEGFLIAKYGAQANIIIQNPNQPESTLQIIEDRFDPIAVEAGQSFSNMLFKIGKGPGGKPVLQMLVEGGGSEKLTVDFTNGAMLNPQQVTELNNYIKRVMNAGPATPTTSTTEPNNNQAALNK